MENPKVLGHVETLEKLRDTLIERRRKYSRERKVPALVEAQLQLDAIERAIASEHQLDDTIIEL